ncbi:methylmalonyl-CoA epimerase [Novosphingobium sp. YJ-S2-02]|uniref:Methylmalonyl-CoA epimerase n=1 Tax=Novosphingobium aureum TaxID=2792964 RepID=A0A931HE83_9SPHN|nr:methylmalonyl-CoA epimerase [Novosphingobium aureum]MBH0113766.1 methylmalonyl-CoA epimerase [Novosphingobium aureum]
MKLGRMNHIGVATPDIEASIAFYKEVMGAQVVTEPFVLESQKVRVCFVETPQQGGALGTTGGTQIELLQPTEADSAVGKWLEKNPLGGQHHICWEVEDITEAKAWFEAQGKRVLGEPRVGAHGTMIFFVHPKDMGGQLTEIMERPREAH